jgi:hypothetical protein
MLWPSLNIYLKAMQQQATSKHDVNLKRHLQPNRIDITRDHEE